MQLCASSFNLSLCTNLFTKTGFNQAVFLGRKLQLLYFIAPFHVHHALEYEFSYRECN